MTRGEELAAARKELEEAKKLLRLYTQLGLHRHCKLEDRLGLEGHIVVDEDAWREWLELTRTTFAFFAETPDGRLGLADIYLGGKYG